MPTRTVAAPLARTRVVRTNHHGDRVRYVGAAVYRDYVHCEKHDECDACGATRRHRSCMCEAAQAERCGIYLDWRADTNRARE